MASSVAWPWAAPAAEPDTIGRHLRWTFELVNPLNEALVDQTMWFYAPAAQLPGQSLQALQVSTSHTRSTDELGHAVVQLAFPHIAPLARRVVTVSAQVQLATQPRASALAKPNDWLGAERYIEVNDPAVQATAQTLRRDSALETTRAIYDWVRQRLQYAGYVADDLGAATALATRRGDCTEYAYLVVALARAAGVPARMLGGYDVDRDAVLRPEGYHNWAEVYFDGRWNLVDAQKERWLAPVERYVAFRIYRDAKINPVGLAHRYALQGRLQAKFL